MAKYSVLLEGQNFPIVVDGVTKLMGFYTTRIVKAFDEKEAVLIALDIVKNDPLLKVSIGRNVDIEPRIEIDSIKSIRWWSRSVSTGYSFYQMENLE